MIKVRCAIGLRTENVLTQRATSGGPHGTWACKVFREGDMMLPAPVAVLQFSDSQQLLRDQ